VKVYSRHNNIMPITYIHQQSKKGTIPGKKKIIPFSSFHNVDAFLLRFPPSCRRSYIEKPTGHYFASDTLQDSRQYESHIFLNPILHFMDYSLFVRCFCVAINCLVITEVEEV
jgi:hypothetical protein